MDALDLLMNPTVELAEDTEAAIPLTAKPPVKKDKTKERQADTNQTSGRFKITDKGVLLLTPSEDDDTPDKCEFVCSKLDVVAMIRDPLSAQWGKLLQWQDPDGRFHEWAMPMAALQGDGIEVRRELATGGLEISQAPKQRYALIRYLSETKTDLRARGVEKTGWYHCTDGYVFVLPDGAVGESCEVVRYQADTISRAYGVAGTAEGWRDEVAALCADNSRCVLALCAGFGAMLLEFSGLESGGINLKGSSSTGKTTALAAAASLFGSPCYVNRWRATSNGLESLAALHNDTLLILDELAQVDPKEAGEIAYMLANGQGKQRSARTGSAKPRQSWQLLFLSAGEIGLAQHMAEGGKKAKAGQEVRLVDVQADAGQGHGLFDTLHGHLNGAALSTAIKAGAAAHHGHAVLEFARVLAEGASVLPVLVKREISLFVQACLPAGETGGQVHRVCERFALLAVAGELASANDITGWRTGEALHAVKRCFTEWLSARGSTTNAEPGAMIEAVRSFISKHEEARFTDLDVEQGGLYRACINRAGWRRKAGSGHEYLIDPSIFQGEVCAGFDVPAVCKVLVDAGYLESGTESGKVRYSIKRRIKGASARRVYVVSSTILET